MDEQSQKTGAVPPAPSGAEIPPEPPASRGERLYRSRNDRMLGGVCGGLGQYFNVDPVFFRLGFVLLTLGWGAGLLVYIVLWIVIPPRGFGEPEPFVVNHFDRHRGGEVVAWILIGVGLLVLASNLQIFQPWMWGQIWPVALIVAGVLLLTNSSLVHRGDR